MNTEQKKSESDLYLFVEGEINAGFRDKGLMHKAKIESAGDASKILPLYYRYRVASLQEEYKDAYEAQRKHRRVNTVRRYGQYLKDPDMPEGSEEGAVDKSARMLGTGVRTGSRIVGALAKNFGAVMLLIFDLVFLAALVGLVRG